jgi:septal ring factor EnvC (AmiA/AmiB activator)
MTHDAENAALRGVIAELAAKNAALQTQHRRERGRLRRALAAIAGMTDYGDGDVQILHEDAISIARAALDAGEVRP